MSPFDADSIIDVVSGSLDPAGAAQCVELRQSGRSVLDQQASARRASK